MSGSGSRLLELLESAPRDGDDTVRVLSGRIGGSSPSSESYGMPSPASESKESIARRSVEQHHSINTEMCT